MNAFVTFLRFFFFFCSCEEKEKHFLFLLSLLSLYSKTLEPNLYVNREKKSYSLYRSSILPYSYFHLCGFYTPSYIKRTTKTFLERTVPSSHIHLIMPFFLFVSYNSVMITFFVLVYFLRILFVIQPLYRVVIISDRS